MVAFAVGAFIGSVITIALMSMMFLAKRADETIEHQNY